MLDAYRDFSWRPDEEDNGRYYKWSHRAGIAAALHALAVRINGADAIRQDILDIAEELGRQAAPSPHPYPYRNPWAAKSGRAKNSPPLNS
jgi:hypothetical protein